MLFHELFSYPPEQVDVHLIKLLEHKEWIPVICRGLLERGNEEGLKILKQISETPGNPYLRTQAHLHLFLHKPNLYSRQKIQDYLLVSGKEEIVRFSQSSKQDKRYSEMFLEPTPEERSELFLQCAQVLCQIKDKAVTDTFFQLLEKGHASNRSLIAAFLLIAMR